MLRQKSSSNTNRQAIAAASTSGYLQQQQRSSLHTTSSSHAESSTASSSSSQGSAASPPPSGSSQAQQQQQSQQKISASLLLSRPPFLTRTPSKFEAAVFAYNNKLYRSLSQPFSKDFYFKKGSAAEVKFEQLEAERRKGGFDLQGKQAGAAKGKGKKDAKSSPAKEVEEDSSPAAAVEDPEQELYAVLPRRTAADEANDVKSLERSGERTLYLLVKDKKSGAWRFPSEPVDRRASGGAASAGQEETEAAEGEAGKGPKDTLHSAAPRAVRKLLGENMDIWLVTHMPVGVLSDEASREKVSP
jgi:large subunit ribosomal protein L46